MVIDNHSHGPERFPWRTLLVAVAASLISGIVIQVLAALIWFGKMEVTQVDLVRDVGGLRVKVGELDVVGSRQIPLIEQRLKLLEAEIVSLRTKLDNLASQQAQINPLTQAQFDSTKANMVRIEDQQRRIIESLDNTYNLLQEHLRDPNAPMKNIPMQRK